MNCAETPKTMRGGTMTPQKRNMVFADNFRHLLEVRGATLHRMAIDTGIHRTRLTRMRDGNTFPRPSELITICEYLDAPRSIYTNPILKETPDAPQ